MQPSDQRSSHVVQATAAGPSSGHLQSKQHVILADSFQAEWKHPEYIKQKRGSSSTGILSHPRMTLNKPNLCTLQLAVGDQRATERHASDVGAQVGHSLQHPGGWVGVKMGELNHVLRNTGEDGSQTHKAVEGRHQLGQVGDLDTLGNGETCRR